MQMPNKRPAWDDLRVLLEVHRRGSFLGAATELGLSTSTVARRIAALEKDLGRPLVHRTTQGVTLEQEGLELITVAEQFDQSLSAHRRDRVTGSPWAGVVRVSLPDGMAAEVAAVIVKLQEAHPETEVELISEARFVDLAAREADIGVRGARSSSPSLIERPLGSVHAGLFATERYLERHLPSRFLAVNDYPSQRFVVDDASPTTRGVTRWLMAHGAAIFPFRSNSTDARIAAAKADAGLVLLGVGSANRHPTLVRVGLEVPLPALPIFLVMHRDLRNAPRMRGVAQAITDAFAGYMAEQAAAEAAFDPSSAGGQAAARGQSRSMGRPSKAPLKPLK